MNWIKTHWLAIKWVGIVLAVVAPTIAYLADQRTIVECQTAREALATRAITAENRIDTLLVEVETLRNERDILKQVKQESAAKSVADAILLPTKQVALTDRLIQLKVKENELKDQDVCKRVLGLLDVARMQHPKAK
jgi:superfamily I DNA and RNA helicase